MKAILNTNYFGNIQYFSVLKNADEVLIEIQDHYEKQSYRNRTEIYGANGLLKLIIPLNRQGKRTLVKDLLIDNTQKWQNEHWRSIQSAYRSSPYFEYYEDHFEAIYKKKHENLLDLNTLLLEKIVSLLKIETKISYTQEYQKTYEGFEDYREVIHPRHKPSENFPKTPYVQVFQEKCGFIPNLSVMDILFNEGPSAVSYF